MFTIKHITSLDEIDKSTWDAIINDNIPHLKYDYLKVLENSFKKNHFFYYILIYNDDQLVATTTAFTKSDFCLDTSAPSKHKKACNNIRKVYKNFLKQKALICGSPVSEFNCLNINREYITFKQDILKLIINECDLIAKKNKIKVVLFKDINCESFDKKLIFNNYGYTRINSMPGTQLDITFNSFDKYLETLKLNSKNDIQARINKGNEYAHLTVEIVEDFLPYVDIMYNLYSNTYNKSQNIFTKLNKDFFYELKYLLGDSVCAILCKLDGRLCGMTILLNGYDSCTNICMGLDYSVAYKYNLYYLMLYKNIEYAIENNKQTLLLGKINYISKLEIGAKLTPLITYAKFNNILTSKLNSLLIRLFSHRYTEILQSKNPIRQLKSLFPSEI